MTKRQLIDEILLLNRSAKPEFLAQFDDEELDAYLRHLQLAQTPRLTCMQGQYARYFDNVPTIDAAGEPTTSVTADSAETAWDAGEPSTPQPTLFDDDLDSDDDARYRVGALPDSDAAPIA